MANEYVLSLTGEEATRFTAAKKVYDSNVIRHFLQKPTLFSMIPSIDMQGGVSKDIIRWYKMTAGKKTDHAATPKQTLTKKVITVRLEDDETVSATTLSKKDEMIVHYDVQGNMAKSAGEAMADLYDVQSLRQLILAARTAADGNFPGGQRVLRSGSAVIDTAYPVSITGSRRLQTDIKTAHLRLFEDNVDMNLERYWFMRKNEHDKLLQDNSLLSRDYVGEAFADKIKGKLLMIDGAWIIPTNNYPQADASAANDDTPTKNGAYAYTGDFSASIAACYVSGGLNATPLVKAEPEPVTGLYYWDDDKRQWTIGAVGFKTIEIYRPECAAEIYISA